MGQLLTISVWEFLHYFKSRSFLLATLVSPILLAGIIVIPSFFYQQSRLVRPQVIGMVEFDSTNYYQMLSHRFTDSLGGVANSPDIHLQKIEPDTSRELADLLSRQERFRFERDSLDDAYNNIKERRKYIFQQPASANRERLLRETYEQLHQTREARDLAVIEYNRIKALTDSLIRAAVFKKADRMLRTKSIQGYIVIEPDQFKEGVIEFHSLLPINFFRIDRLKQTLQEFLVEERMREQGVTSSQIQEWLKPIHIQELRLEGSEKREFNVMITYLGPIIAVLFLFINMFSSSGFLFNSIIFEKTNHIVEQLLSSVGAVVLIFGKLLGMGLLALFQMLIWMLIIALLIMTNLIPLHEVGFLTLQNGGIFILYSLLGYLFFSAIFIVFGCWFPAEEKARQLNQLIRVVSIFPIILAILVLETPNALTVRVLSFIPFLTPSFMILRTPLGQPPDIDYAISAGIMIGFILIALFVAVRVFKISSVAMNRPVNLKKVFMIFGRA